MYIEGVPFYEGTPHFMMKKILIGLFIVLIVVIGIAIIPPMVASYTTETSVSYGRYPLKLYEGTFLATSNKKFIFDSGAEISHIGKGFCKSKIVGFAESKDCNQKKRRSYLCYTSHVEPFPNFLIENLVFIRENTILNFGRKKKVVNVIGMDVICQANWYFSIRDSFFETLPLDRQITLPSDAMVLSYDNNKRPLITLLIENQKYEEVLIDMGCNIDFCLDESTLNAINNSLNPRKIWDSFCNGIYSIEKATSYMYDGLDVFGKTFNDVHVQGYHQNLVGMKFLSRFDHLFWDSRHRKVYLWNEEEK